MSEPDWPVGPEEIWSDIGYGQTAKYVRADLYDELRAENERLQRERDEALAREKANFGRYIEASQKAEQARAKALEEAAAAFRRNALGAMLAGDVDRIEAAILALREKP